MKSWILTLILNVDEVQILGVWNNRPSEYELELWFSENKSFDNPIDYFNLSNNLSSPSEFDGQYKIKCFKNIEEVESPNE